MRLLVTGGAGFIGSNFVRHVLSTSDDSITIFDALTYAASAATLDDVLADRRVRFVFGDVRDAVALSAALDGHDAVVHMAAETHVDRSITDGSEFVQTNCFGTQVVCAVAGEIGVERVVMVSTDEVYGSVAVGRSLETDHLEPSSPYSASKAGADLIALSHARTHGLPVVVTRSSNNLGPFQHPEKLIPRFITNLLRGRPVPLYGDGGNQRDWCSVTDNCTALDLVLRSGRPGEIYNIGAGNERTNLAITKALLQLCGRDESFIEKVPDRPGHDRRYSVDTARIRSMGWSPREDFDATLAATVDWYRANAWWWEPLVG